jgi:hypothetical protein
MFKIEFWAKKQKTEKLDFFTLFNGFTNPFLQNIICFMPKTILLLHLCFNKPNRKKQTEFHALLQFTDKH